jgi:hypothetical protein
MMMADHLFLVTNSLLMEVMISQVLLLKLQDTQVEVLSLLQILLIQKLHLERLTDSFMLHTMPSVILSTQMS